jgi:hypothetical protein
MLLPASAAVLDRLVKTEMLLMRVTITANATPALKGRYSDVGAVIACEGQTAELEAVETGLSYTAVDADGDFAILLKKEDLTDGAELDTVYDVVLARIVAGGSPTIELAASAGVTPAGHLFLQVEGADSLATTTCDLLIALRYTRK